MSIQEKIHKERKTASHLFGRFDLFRKITAIGIGAFFVAFLCGFWPGSLFVGGVAFFFGFLANHYGTKSFAHWRKAQNLARVLAERSEARTGSRMESEESSERGGFKRVAPPIVEHSNPFAP